MRRWSNSEWIQVDHRMKSYHDISSEHMVEQMFVWKIFFSLKLTLNVNLICTLYRKKQRQHPLKWYQLAQSRQDKYVLRSKVHQEEYHMFLLNAAEEDF